MLQLLLKNIVLRKTKWYCQTEDTRFGSKGRNFIKYLNNLKSFVSHSLHLDVQKIQTDKNPFSEHKKVDFPLKLRDGT